MNGDDRAGWELQWQPAGGGRTRRLVLSRQGLRRLLLALGFLGLLVVGGGVAAGRDGYRFHGAVDAAGVENDLLKTRQDALRERASVLLGRQETLDGELSRSAGEDPSVR